MHKDEVTQINEIIARYKLAVDTLVDRLVAKQTQVEELTNEVTKLNTQLKGYDNEK